jgi:hypothetical protein
MKRGSQTACNRKLDYHDSCTLCRGCTLYPRVVISSPAKRLENLLFAILYTSFGVWPRDHYMSLQRPTTEVCHALLRFPAHSGPACNAEVSHTQRPLLHHVVQAVHKEGHTDRSHPHSNEHDTQPITYLISKQVIPYQTRGGTCCPGGLLLRFSP